MPAFHAGRNIVGDLALSSTASKSQLLSVLSLAQILCEMSHIEKE
jgi:hypothetical protein